MKNFLILEWPIGHDDPKRNHEVKRVGINIDDISSIQENDFGHAIFHMKNGDIIDSPGSSSSYRPPRVSVPAEVVGKECWT